MRGLLLAQWMSKALATHAKSFSTTSMCSATSHSRPRWVYIAHTQRLAVGSKVLEKTGQTVVPPAKGRNYREHANGYKTSRCREIRNNRRSTCGTSATTGSSAQSMVVLPLSQTEQHMLTKSAKSKLHRLWKMRTAPQRRYFRHAVVPRTQRRNYRPTRSVQRKVWTRGRRRSDGPIGPHSEPLDLSAVRTGPKDQAIVDRWIQIERLTQRRFEKPNGSSAKPMPELPAHAVVPQVQRRNYRFQRKGCLHSFQLNLQNTFAKLVRYANSR